MLQAARVEPVAGQAGQVRKNEKVKSSESLRCLALSKK